MSSLRVIPGTSSSSSSHAAVPVSRQREVSLAVIGGGLAGIAAAEAAVRRGWNVEIFEWSRVLGGRAASIFEPVSRCWIDNGQHVMTGSCTELRDLNRRLGLSDLFQRTDTVSYVGAGERRWTLSASHYLPGRWQLVPSFLKNPFLSFKERLATGLLIRKLFKLNERSAFSDRFRVQGGPGSDCSNSSDGVGFAAGEELSPQTISFGQWLRLEGASEESLQRFWNPLIYGTLNDTVDAVCLFAAQKVVKNGFMSGRDAMATYYPKCPLREIYHIETHRQLERLGVRTHFFSRVDRLCFEESPQNRSASGFSSETVGNVRSLCLNDGTQRQFDRFVLAIPAYRACRLLDDSGCSNFTDTLGFERFELGAITAVHLWFDRPIFASDERRIAILDGPGRWLFCADHFPIAQRPADDGWSKGYYHQVVISASHRVLEEEELVSRGRRRLVERVLEQLRRAFPGTFSAPNPPTLMHHRATTVFDAVFSPRPDLYRFRPSQQTPLANLVFAGDWTQTDWPATMEGAVRSGRGAVAILASGDEDGAESGDDRAGSRAESVVRAFPSP